MRALKITKQITNRKFTSIDKYLFGISKIPLITAEEEVELAKRIKSGDSLALEKLVRSNLRFVVSVSKKYQYSGISLEDLINEGNLGLIKAAYRFDASRGFKFISYGVWWIRQSILQAIAQQSRMVKLPHNRLSILNKVNSTISILEQKYAREPSAEELSLILDLPYDEIVTTITSSGRQISIDQPFDNEDSNCLSDLLKCTSEITPDSALNNESLKKDIQRAIVKLSERKIKILTLYFGLNGAKSESLEEIANELKLTTERVRQLKNQALMELRKTPISNTIKNYMCN